MKYLKVEYTEYHPLYNRFGIYCKIIPKWATVDKKVKHLSQCENYGCGWKAPSLSKEKITPENKTWLIIYNKEIYKKLKINDIISYDPTT